MAWGKWREPGEDALSHVDVACLTARALVPNLSSGLLSTVADPNPLAAERVVVGVGGGPEGVRDGHAGCSLSVAITASTGSGLETTRLAPLYQARMPTIIRGKSTYACVGHCTSVVSLLESILGIERDCGGTASQSKGKSCGDRKHFGVGGKNGENVLVKKVG